MAKNFFIVIALWLSAFSVYAEPPQVLAPYYVVLDAGHGGDDKGVTLQGQIEKNYTLQLALEIETRLKSNPAIQTILTRKDDYALSFDERRRIANTHTPGLYLSLHMGEHSKIYFLPPTGKAQTGLFIPIDQAHDNTTSSSIRWGGFLADALKPTFPSVQLGMIPIPLVSLVGIQLPAVLLEVENADIINIASGVVTAIDRFTSEGKNPTP